MNIALMAHDNKKELMIQFCIAYCGILAKHTVCGTGTTARVVAEATGMPVKPFMARAHGGIQQIGARITYDEIDMVIYLSYPKDEDDEANLSYIRRLCGRAQRAHRHQPRHRRDAHSGPRPGRPGLARDRPSPQRKKRAVTFSTICAAMTPHEYVSPPSAREQGHRLEALPRKEGRKTAAERGRRRPRSAFPHPRRPRGRPLFARVEFGWHHESTARSSKPAFRPKADKAGRKAGFFAPGEFGCGADYRRLPLGGKLSPQATDEGAGLGQLSLCCHLIRPFGPPSPQGEGFGSLHPPPPLPPSH